MTGSAAACFAKICFQKDNRLFQYINTFEHSLVLKICAYIILVLLFIYSNMKMIENKIRSFAIIGASMTVIVAFFSNYIFGCICEAIFWHQYPQFGQYIGSGIVLSGIFV